MTRGRAAIAIAAALLAGPLTMLASRALAQPTAATPTPTAATPPAATPTAVATSPALAATAGNADDARRSVLVGPSGQVYEPDDHGGWARHREGGIAATVTTATLVGRTVIAGGAGSPPYRFVDGNWTALHLGRGAPVVGTGTRAVAAVGREVFALDHGEPKHLADAPAAVIAIASGTGVVIATAQGKYLLDGTTFRRMDGLPPSTVLVSDEWTLVDTGVRALRSGVVIAWPTDDRVAIVAPAPKRSVAAVGISAAGVELLVVRPGRDGHAGTVDRDRIPLPPPATARAVGVVVDRDGRAVVAFADGTLAVRDRGQWAISTIRDDLPTAHTAGPSAAISQ